jgi:hypothetical protein
MPETYTELHRRIADKIAHYGRLGLDAKESAPLIDHDFPEATEDDKSCGFELGAAMALARSGCVGRS